MEITKGIIGHFLNLPLSMSGLRKYTKKWIFKFPFAKQPATNRMSLCEKIQGKGGMVESQMLLRTVRVKKL